MTLIRDGLRKAGQYLNNHRLIAGLAGAGGVLGTVGILQKLSQNEQHLVLDAALEAEREGGGKVLGMSSGTLLGAAVVLEMMENDEDESKTISSNVKAADDRASDVRVEDLVNKQRRSTPRNR